MVLKLKQSLVDSEGLRKILDTMAHEIAEESFDFSNFAIVGILKTGAPIADYLAAKISKIRNVEIPTAYLDITLYRDDMIDTEFDPVSRHAEIPFPVKNRQIIMVDDVLFTGRTVRAGLSSLVSFGRPKLVRLAVVVDRGHRELPIKADYVGMKTQTTLQQGIRVRMNVPQTQDGIYLFEES